MIRDHVDNGLIPQAVCLAEVSLGHTMMHMYTAQHLRALTIAMTTMSDAYNVVVNFKLRSDGKFSVRASRGALPPSLAFSRLL